MALHEYLGTTPDAWEVWGHDAAVEEMSVADLPYLRAGKLIRMLVHPGIFVDEALLAIRLGIDSENSRDWGKIKKILKPVEFRGLGNQHLDLWWARGLEEWWQSLGPDRPLAGTNISERGAVLREKEGLDVADLVMPPGSPGTRPWRTCLLSWEGAGKVIPVDPTRAVRVTPRRTLPSWMDPLVAALGPANRSREDVRLNREDLERLLQMFGDS